MTNHEFRWSFGPNSLFEWMVLLSLFILIFINIPSVRVRTTELDERVKALETEVQTLRQTPERKIEEK